MYVKPKDLSHKGGQLSVDYGQIPFLRSGDKKPKGRRRGKSTFAKTGARSFTLHLWRNYKEKRNKSFDLYPIEKNIL